MPIRDDADLSGAMPGAALGIIINSGQGCVCGLRICVQRGVYDQVADGMARAGRAAARRQSGNELLSAFICGTSCYGHAPPVVMFNVVVFSNIRFVPRYTGRVFGAVGVKQASGDTWTLKPSMPLL